MRRIAVINQKGGVGKTTTTASLGAALGLAGQRVLLIDLDPQAHLSLHFGSEVGEAQASVYDVLTSGTPIREAAMNVRERINLVASDIDLAGAEAELISVTGREVILREAVDVVAAEYDVMLIDCPPSLGVLTINALAAAEEVVIPLQAHFLALQGLGKLFDTVTLVRQRINPALRVGGVVLCMHEAFTRLAMEVVGDLTGFLEGARGSTKPWAEARVFSTCVRRNIKLAESCSFGQTVFDYAPRSNGALDYAALTEEIFGVTVPIGGAPTPAEAESKAPMPVSSGNGQQVPSPKSIAMPSEDSRKPAEAHPPVKGVEVREPIDPGDESAVAPIDNAPAPASSASCAIVSEPLAAASLSSPA